jgi:hypothetical protein
MSIEELKIVLETIRSLSGDASTAAYWYFGLEFAKFVLGWLVGAGVVLTFLKTVAAANGVGSDELFIRACRDLLNIGDGDGGKLYNSERKATYAAIRKLIKESKA